MTSAIARPDGEEGGRMFVACLICGHRQLVPDEFSAGVLSFLHVNEHHREVGLDTIATRGVVDDDGHTITWEIRALTAEEAEACLQAGSTRLH